MEKISINGGNSFCPQALYLYGTYTADGKPNYALFCWCAYCAVGNQLKFVACIGEDKLTRDRIRETGILSATVVTDELLPAADFCGCNSGKDVDKANVIPTEKGTALDVPVPVNGMWTMELKVDDTLHPEGDENSDVYICSIKNVRADGRLADDSLSFEEKLALMKPVVTMCGKYIPVETRSIGDWGSQQGKLDRPTE